MKLTINVPARLFGAAPADEVARRVKLNAALMMFRSGEISVGAACELAEVHLFAFSAACEARGIPLIHYSEDELRAELESLKQVR